MPDIIGTSMDYLLPNSRVMVKYINDKPVSIEMPDFVELTVADTPPRSRRHGHQPVQGSQAGNRPDRLGAPFIKSGEKIRIDTRTGEYLERVK